MTSTTRIIIKVLVIIVVVIQMWLAWHFVFNKDASLPFVATSTQKDVQTSSTPIITTNTTPRVSPATTTAVQSAFILGKKFTIGKNTTAHIGTTGLEIVITNFVYSPCPKGAQCIWSGLGIEFEYHYDGKTEKGMNLAQAFGYHVTIEDTDYKTYATLIVEKLK